MITEPTLFILGAGASHAYGLPLGNGLIDIIIEGLANPQNRQFQQFKLLGFEDREIVDFRETIKACGYETIDTFLGIRDAEEQLQRMGRLAIAQAIFEKEQFNPILRGAGAEHWYSFLWEKMTTLPNGHVKDPNEIMQNQVMFATFNYDRTLEMFLFNSIKTTYKGIIDPEDALSIVESIPIVHVHGSLGPIMKWGENHVRFQIFSKQRYKDEGAVVKLIEEGSGGIILPHQASPGVWEQSQEASELYSYARRVYIIGLGYDINNLKKVTHHIYTPPSGTALSNALWRQKWFQRGVIHPQKTIQGTLMDVSQDRINSTSTYFKKQTNNISFSELTASKFIRVIDLS